jgi:hypothetical protein
MNMWRNEGEQFGSAFNLTAQPYRTGLVGAMTPIIGCRFFC